MKHKLITMNCFHFSENYWQVKIAARVIISILFAVCLAGVFLLNFPAIVQANPSGTGFFITENLLVTNFHVIDQATDVIVKLSNGNKYTATIMKTDRYNDLAIIRVENLTDPIIPINFGNIKEVKPGNRVYTIGYPLGTDLSASAKISEGIINSLSGYKDDPRSFQISIPLQPGNSGGPLINSKGEVIGITTSGLGLKYLYTTGVLPQNVNFAIKFNYVQNLLDLIPDKPIMNKSDKNIEMDATMAMESIEKSVAMILVKRPVYERTFEDKIVGKYFGNIDGWITITEINKDRNNKLIGIYICNDTRHGTYVGKLSDFIQTGKYEITVKWDDKGGIGLAVFRFSDDFSSFTGTWGKGANVSQGGTWSGNRH